MVADGRRREQVFHRETQRGHDLLLRAFLRVTVQDGAAVLARADRETALEINSREVRETSEKLMVGGGRIELPTPAL